MDNSDTPLDKIIEGCLTVIVVMVTVIGAFWYFSQALHQ